MFPWNIAKTAEAMFSRWAIKHVCKFLLKKKLGQFIIGDLDLDQLDVQLGAGTIQLSDLALNVDFINQKLGVSPVIVKEGSIGSLLVKLPWRVKNCQIEVEELELVLAPSVGNARSTTETSSSTQDLKQPVNNGSEQLEHEMESSGATSIPLDVHEGVKTIAKMVQWLLTSFSVKVNKLIVAYDPCLEKDERCLGSDRALVLRISEIEYGTCVSEDADGSADTRIDSFLGMSRLTNFVKFKGAVIELLHMEDIDNQAGSPSASGTTFSEWYMGHSPLDSTAPILTGEDGGFSGNMKISIPWKNGSLDIEKVDADVSIDPLELRLQLNTIMWILCFWESLKNLDKSVEGHKHCKDSDSIYLNSLSQFHSSIIGSAVTAADQVMPRGESLSTLISHELANDALLQGSHFIPDWVPLTMNKNQNDRLAEPDFGASIDQFFECFDGLRTSQSALGNSGIWNWTCSVFSAITAASSLASGSLHIPSEHQPNKTNFKATVTRISVVLCLDDEDQEHACDEDGNPINVRHNIHYLNAMCQDLLLVLQIRPREMKFEATVKHIELDDYFYNEKDVVELSSSCEDSIQSQVLSIQHLQAKVQDALPPFPLFQDFDSDIHIRDVSHGIFPKEKLVKIRLLKTSAASYCQFTMNSTSSDGRLSSLTSFSVKLPPFIFWVNFDLLNVMLDLLKQVESSLEMKNQNKDFAKDSCSGKFDSSYDMDVKGNSFPRVTSLSSKASLQGDIVLPNARIIFCFPFEKCDNAGRYCSWDQFVGLDISQPLSKENNSKARQVYSCEASCSISMNISNLNMYLVSTCYKDDKGSVGGKSSATSGRTYSAQEILSVTNRANNFSAINVLWQNGPVTGPWIAHKARSLATSQDSRRSRNKVRGKGYEYASTTTMGDLEDVNSRTRQEIIFSSEIFLHIRLSPVLVKLDGLQYQLLQLILNQVMDGLSCVARGSNTSPIVNINTAVTSASQTSVLLDCDSVEILMNLDKSENRNCSIQKELSGSWQSVKLQLQKFELLSVANIGGIRGASFLWVGHGEGQLLGSIGGVPDQEFLLISCSDSVMRRGDGEGANAMSLGSAGTAICHLQERHNFHSFTSVTVRCGTIVAHGGRVDWLNAICHFFSSPSFETEQASIDSAHKGCSEDNSAYGTSFVLNLVDIGFVYEPHVKSLVVGGRISESKSGISVHPSEVSGEQYVACLLAAASLSLSNQTVANSVENDYKIKFQDLGLLLRSLSDKKISTRSYDVNFLHKMGYVKVAGEALVEAVLRTNCQNGLLWELECADSHITFDTCHDTTSGLIRLVAQLQQLFAPDMEESVVHLQTRWNNVQQAHTGLDIPTETKDFTGGCATSSFPAGHDATGSKGYGVGGLMDQICEDAFQLKGKGTSPSDPCPTQCQSSLDGSFYGEVCNLDVITPDFFSQNVSLNGSMPRTRLGSSQAPQTDAVPELIESYYITGLNTLSDLSARNHLLKVDSKRVSRNDGHKKKGCGNNGWYRDTSLKIVDNHIPDASENVEMNQFLGVDELPSTSCIRPAELCIAKGRVLLKKIDVRWRMYAGSDWPGKRKDALLTAETSGRDTTVCLEFTLCGMDLQYDMFPDGEVFVSKLSLSVQDFHLYDNSKNAPWKLVLGYYHSKDHPRDSSAKAFRLDLEAVRPDPLTPLEEYRLRLALLPMLLHLDQDQLDFLISFFGEKSSSVDQLPSLPRDLGGPGVVPVKTNDFGGYTIEEEALLPFFQKFDIWPVVFRVDYNPRRVDLAALRGGNYVHLVNLVPWKGIELQLKHVHAVGIYGWNSVCETIAGEWLEDISNNQIHKFLKGLPPIRSLFTVGSGAAKLVSLPVKNYKKDRRLLTGIQRGAIAFLRSISLEAVGLGVHLASGAHEILLQTEHILTSIPPSVPSSVRSKTKTNLRSNQPRDAQQGIQQAYESLSDGLGRTASALVGTPLKTYQRGGGAGSALASAVCAAPAAAIAPASAAMRAVHCALLGFRNSLDPEHKKESMEKYLGPDQPQDRS